MGRRSEGVRYRKVGGIWTVRFRIRGKRHEYSTGIPAPKAAKRPSQSAVDEGEQIYAQALQGKRPGRVAAARAASASGSLADLLADWLDDLTVREPTKDVYDVFTVVWLREWHSLSQLTDAAIAAYFRRRLREVRRKSVLNESSALRKFLTWCVETGQLAESPAIPSVPKTVNGTAYVDRRRTAAPELSADEIESLLAELPERSDTGFPVQARFIVMWETTLRPETLDKLSVPENWSPGESVLRIRADDDKEAHAREIPLTPRAVKALASVAPESGIIFGFHKFARYLGPAAAAALSPGKAAIFTGQHIRSAAITRWLEASGNLPGTMFLAGHKHASTTSRYARPSFRAALDVIGSIRGRKRGRKQGADRESSGKDA